jgi:Lysyl oxidase
VAPTHARLIALGAACLSLIAAAPALAAPLVPDMRTRPLPTSGSDPFIQAGGTTGKQLAFSNGWANYGDGPWETAPAGPASADDCDNDGDNDNDVIVNERVYNDDNNNGAFDRGVDTTFTNHPAGCMVFHPAHNHFHIEDAGQYSLLAEPTGAPAGISTKVSFCLLDIGSFNLSLPGAPASSFYTGCNPSVQGISVGWFDEYGAHLAGQQIDLNSGLPAGNYCLRSEFDPLNRFVEQDETNNVAQQRYFIDAASFVVTPLAGACVLDQEPPPPVTPPPTDTPPDTKIVSGPEGKTADASPRFRFRANEPATFACSLDGKRWRLCESPKQYRQLDEGRHRFTVRATDGAGNVEPEPARARFKVVVG